MEQEQSMLEIVGTVVEGPIPEFEAACGGVKLVQFAGNISVLYVQDIHPSMVNLKAGQQVCSRYITSDQPPRTKPYQGGE